MELTNNERTLLMIAVAGERVMPIGQWKAAAESLLAKGLLHRHGCPQDPTGNFNLVITDAGRKASEEAEYHADQQLMQAFSAIGRRGHLFRTKIEQAAKLLHEAARTSATDLNRNLIGEVERLGREMVDYAREMAEADPLPTTPMQRQLKKAFGNDSDSQG